MLQTEYEFVLPNGYIDKDGNLHKEGIMRLATAADEILPLKDPRVENNPSYFVIILLSRVITKLGELKQINPKTVEDLFAEDMKFLESFYNKINGHEEKHFVTCPECQFEIQVEENGLGGS